MKEKNLLDDIESKSLEELNNLANKIVNNAIELFEVLDTNF